VSFYERALRPLLFRMDPERAHNVGMALIVRGLVRGLVVSDPRLRVTRNGIEFPNPIGLAAGFDKNGVATRRWAGLGFGFAEIGTVTPLAQPGNPAPRLFRFPEQQAVVNRMGFNNAGAAAMAATLRRAGKAGIPIGINLGKNKAIPDDAAHVDYATAYRQLREFADYVVINVSSPNTPGLRSLQSVDALKLIVDAIRAEDGPHPPLFIKLAPDLANEDLMDVRNYAVDAGLAGLIATNTTLDHSSIPNGENVVGGLSGKPLARRSTEVVRLLRKGAPPEFTIIGVGGIFDAQGMREKLDAGANLVQLYSGWVYGGPGLVGRMLLNYLDALPGG